MNGSQTEVTKYLSITLVLIWKKKGDPFVKKYTPSKFQYSLSSVEMRA